MRFFFDSKAVLTELIVEHVPKYRLRPRTTSSLEYGTNASLYQSLHLSILIECGKSLLERHPSVHSRVGPSKIDDDDTPLQSMGSCQLGEISISPFH